MTPPLRYFNRFVGGPAAGRVIPTDLMAEPIIRVPYGPGGPTYHPEDEPLVPQATVWKERRYNQYMMLMSGVRVFAWVDEDTTDPARDITLSLLFAATGMPQ